MKASLTSELPSTLSVLSTYTFELPGLHFSVLFRGEMSSPLRFVARERIPQCPHSISEKQVASTRANAPCTSAREILNERRTRELRNEPIFEAQRQQN